MKDLKDYSLSPQPSINNCKAIERGWTVKINF